MSNFTQQEETEIVKDAMTLTTAIHIGTKELARQKALQFKKMPAAPTKQVLNVPKITAQIPKPQKSTYSYFNYLNDKFEIDSNKILMRIFLCFITFGLYLCYFLFTTFQEYIKIKREKDNALATNPEYLQSVADAKQHAIDEQQRINDEIARKQQEIDEKYESDLKHYQTTIIPDYNREFDQWKNNQQEKITILAEDIKLYHETLNNLYESTKIISVHYRELWILRWLYDDMSSSDHDIRYATELLDRDRQRYATMISAQMVTEAVNSMHSSMIAGFNCVYEAIESGNAELAKMRREQNLANVVGIVQRHKLNKMIKNQNEMLGI